MTSLRDKPHRLDKPGAGHVLLVLGVIVFSFFAYMTFEWDMYPVSEPEYDWAEGDIGIVSYRILATSEEDDQITIKNNHKFAIMVREFEVNGVELAAGRSYLLNPGQAVTLTEKIGRGDVGDRFEYGVYVLYDDYNSNIIGYEYKPNVNFVGVYE